MQPFYVVLFLLLTACPSRQSRPPAKDASAPASPIVKKVPMCEDAPRACYERGVERQQEKDFTVAAALFGEACERQDSFACNGLGRLYEFGHGFSQDLPLAIEHYDKACELGDAPVCYYLGHILSRGSGMDPTAVYEVDLERAKPYYRRGCLGGYDDACLALQIPPVHSEADMIAGLATELRKLATSAIIAAQGRAELPPEAALKTVALAFQWSQSISAASYVRLTGVVYLLSNGDIRWTIFREDVPGRSTRALLTAAVWYNRGPSPIAWAMNRALTHPQSGSCDFDWITEDQSKTLHGELQTHLRPTIPLNQKSCEALQGDNWEVQWLPTTTWINVRATADGKNHDLTLNYQIEADGTIVLTDTAPQRSLPRLP